jgi:hypothetical protein
MLKLHIFHAFILYRGWNLDAKILNEFLVNFNLFIAGFIFKFQKQTKESFQRAKFVFLSKYTLQHKT